MLYYVLLCCCMLLYVKVGPRKGQKFLFWGPKIVILGPQNLSISLIKTQLLGSKNHHFWGPQNLSISLGKTQLLGGRFATPKFPKMCFLPSVRARFSKSVFRNPPASCPPAPRSHPFPQTPYPISHIK